MKAIILAAGEGRRLRPLTEDRPKPMVLVNGEPLIKHIFAELPATVSELIVVVGYKGEQIRDFLGAEYGGRKITYVAQTEAHGTGHALMLCRELIQSGERFLFMFADDIHPQADLARLVSYERAMLVYQVVDPSQFGVVIRDGENHMVNIIEKPKKNPPSNLASTGVFVLDGNIFDYESSEETNGEIHHTDMVRAYVKGGHAIKLVKQKRWIPVGFPQDIPSVEAYLEDREAEVEP